MHVWPLLRPIDGAQVNAHSRELHAQKVRREVAQLVPHIDPDGTGSITKPGIDLALRLLGIFDPKGGRALHTQPQRPPRPQQRHEDALL
eukprot:11754535-Ditylum_brightwellii.AAC.1